MDYRHYNIAKPRKETMKDGTEKTFWDTVGKLTIFTKEDGSESGKIELVTFANNIILNAFPYAKKEGQASQPAKEPIQEDEIRVENIPF